MVIQKFVIGGPFLERFQKFSGDINPFNKNKFQAFKLGSYFAFPRI